jgi:hypothetical protein
VRFELTILRICNPLQLTTLPLVHKFGADSETRTRRILLLRQARIPIPSYPHGGSGGILTHDQGIMSTLLWDTKLLTQTGAPRGIRTPDMRCRRPLFYPAEL